MQAALLQGRGSGQRCGDAVKLHSHSPAAPWIASGQARVRALQLLCCAAVAWVTESAAQATSARAKSQLRERLLAWPRFAYCFDGVALDVGDAAPGGLHALLGAGAGLARGRQRFQRNLGGAVGFRHHAFG